MREDRRQDINNVASPLLWRRNGALTGVRTLHSNYYGVLSTVSCLFLCALCAFVVKSLLQADPGTNYSVTWDTQSHFENNGAPNSNYTGPTTRTNVSTVNQPGLVTLKSAPTWSVRTIEDTLGTPPSTIPYAAMVYHPTAGVFVWLPVNTSAKFYIFKPDIKRWYEVSSSGGPSPGYGSVLSWDGYNLVWYGHGFQDVALTMSLYPPKTYVLRFLGGDPTVSSNWSWNYVGEVGPSHYANIFGDDYYFSYALSGMAYHSASGKVVWFGGRATMYGYTDDITNKVYLWTSNGTTGGSWLQAKCTTTPTACYTLSLAPAPNNRLLMMGGDTTTGSGGLTNSAYTVEVNGPANTVTFTAIAAGPSARCHHKAAYDPVLNRTIIFGGNTVDGTSSGTAAGNNLDDTWEWDGAAWSQKTPAVKPLPRYTHVMANGGGLNLIFGGRFGSTNLTDTWLYGGSGASRYWWTCQNQPTVKTYAAAAGFDGANKRVVFFGGQASLGNLSRNETWLYDSSISPAQWRCITSTTTPPQRHYHAMAWDTTNTRVVMTGGISQSYTTNTYLNDTYLWDGTNWTAGAVLPAARYNHAMAYYTNEAGTQKGVICFGGANSAGTSQNTTYRWDGASWTDITASVVISGAASIATRQGHAMCFDPVRKRIIMFGGNTNTFASPSYTSETWEFFHDGANWVWEKKTPVASPQARWYHKMGYPLAGGLSGLVIMTGGTGSSGYGSSCWGYDGQTWTQYANTNINAASDAASFDPNTLKVMRHYNETTEDCAMGYPTGGTLNGLIIQAPDLLEDWGTIAYQDTRPPGASITYKTRGAATLAGLASASWSTAYTSSGDKIKTLPSRWLEVTATLTTATDKSQTPALDQLTVTYTKYRDCFTSIQSGPWDDPNTWQDSSGLSVNTPTIEDLVIITGTHQVTLRQPGSARRLEMKLEGQLLLDATTQPVTLTLYGGSALSISGSARLKVNRSDYTCSIRAQNPATATLTSTALDLNQKQLSLGNLTITGTPFIITNGAEVTIIDNLTCGQGLTIEGASETNRGKLIHKTSGKTLTISGGHFLIKGRFEMSAQTDHTYVDFNSSKEGAYSYHIIVSGTGSACIQGLSNQARCYFRQLNKPYGIILLPGSASLFDYCDIRAQQGSLYGYYSSNYSYAAIYAQQVQGPNDSGDPGITEGLTIRNSIIKTGPGGGIRYNGLRLNQCQNNHITGNTIMAYAGSSGYSALRIYSPSTTKDTGHTISDNTFCSELDPENPGWSLLNGIHFEGCYTSITLTGNSVYNTQMGFYIWSTTTDTRFILEDCIFGSPQPNTVADIYWNDTAYPAKVDLYNCLLASPVELGNTTALNESSSVIISRNHDRVKGLWRIWGDWQHNEGELVFDYTQETYAGAGDQNTQKIIEFGPSAVPPGAASQYRQGVTGTALARLKLIGDPNYPTVVRGLNNQVYYFMIGVQDEEPYDGYVAPPSYLYGKYTQFYDLGAGLEINNSGVLVTETDKTALNYCSFFKPAIGTCHLNIQGGGSVTISNVSFGGQVGNPDVVVRVAANPYGAPSAGFDPPNAVTKLWVINYAHPQAPLYEGDNVEDLDYLDCGGCRVFFQNETPTWASVQDGHWDNAATWGKGTAHPGTPGTDIPGIDNFVTISHEVTVHADAACASAKLTYVNPTQSGKLRFDLASSSIKFTIKNGGKIDIEPTAKGIDFVNAGSGKSVTFTASAPVASEAGMWVYDGPEPNWGSSSNLTCALDHSQFRTTAWPSISISGTNTTLIFAGNIKTAKVVIQKGNTLKFTHNYPEPRTWWCQGDIVVGSAVESGRLEFYPKTKTYLKVTNPG